MMGKSLPDLVRYMGIGVLGRLLTWSRKKNVPLKKAQRLRQTDEVWESTVQRMRIWITPDDQVPYRPYVVLTASRTGQVAGSDLVDDAPTPDQLLNALARAMYYPTLGGGGKRRPAAIYVDDKALAEALAPRLQEIGIRCEYRHTLREAKQALASMEQFMGEEEPIPGLLKLPGVTPYLVQGLFEAAAFFYREAPWRWIDDSRPIEVRYPPDGQARYAVVMGHGGETYGLAVYNSPDELREIYSGMPPDQLIERMQWTAVLFGEAMEMPFDDLDDMEKYNWPVEDELAYPLPIRYTRSGPSRPGKSELLWFEAALLAIPIFVRERLRADEGIPLPDEDGLTVAMADGEARIHLRYPVPGFEVPYEVEWAALEEEEQAEIEAACERNAELLHVFERWLGRKGLSTKTVQKHLVNVGFFADAYMAAAGGSAQVPRPADQAEAADVDEFLSDWFMDMAAWGSVETVKSNIASLKKFYACLKEMKQMSIEQTTELLTLLRTELDYYIELAQDYEEDFW
jgi:hypothetical protein